MKRSSSSKLDRKTVEKNRRTYMKSLCFELSSLIPPQQNSSSKEVLTLLDQLDNATNYIKNLRERIEELKARKKVLMSTKEISRRDSMETSLRMPIVEIRALGSNFEVILTCGMNKKFMLYEVISILEEEGAQVVNVSLSTVGDKIFHTIYSQERCSRVGVQLSRVADRLKELVC